MRTAILLLAASLAAGTPALALDLPTERLKPASEPCPGKPGFVRLPGSQSCTRLSGRVATGANVRTGAAGTAGDPDIAGRLAIDNRTETDFGEVRTFVRIGNGRR
jgi:hypothetical protein